MEVQDVRTEVKRCVETWRDEPTPDAIKQKYSGRTWEGIALQQWPETEGVVYKQVVENYWGLFEMHVDDIVEASMEIFRRGEWLDEALRKITRLEKEKEALEGEVNKTRKAFLRCEAGEEEAKAKLLRSEVARENAEAEWKTLVEQRDTVQYGVMQHDRVMQQFELFAKTRQMSYMMTRRY